MHRGTRETGRFVCCFLIFAGSVGQLESAMSGVGDAQPMLALPGPLFPRIDFSPPTEDCAIVGEGADSAVLRYLFLFA